MTASHARCISTNQSGVHSDLAKVLEKHKTSECKRPVAAHTALAFNDLIDWLGLYSGAIILDAGCGVGESTINIAAQYPHAKVIGIDKSIARLEKHKSYACQSQEAKVAATSGNVIHSAHNNYILLQADLNDFWRLLVSYLHESKPQWHIIKQFILYPNPYPKKTQLGKRWHGSALFPVIVSVCANIEVRSNWLLYLQEFLLAAQYYQLNGSISAIVSNVESLPYTPFERKYLDSDQACFKLVLRP